MVDHGHQIVSGDLYVVDLEHPQLRTGRIAAERDDVEAIEHAPSVAGDQIAFLRGVEVVAELRF